MSVPFQSSADTWFFPPSKQSAWFAQIDWYLNWQMLKGTSYSGFHMPVETLKTAQNFDVTILETPTRPSPLLVSSQGRIPANQCVVVDDSTEIATWLKKIADVAEGLKSKSILIFLPRGTVAGSAQEKWSKIGSPCAVQFINDGETTA